MARHVQRVRLSRGRVRYRYYYYLNGKTYYSKAIYEDEGLALVARQDALITATSRANGASLFRLIEKRLDDLSVDKSDKYLYDTRHYLELAKQAWGDVPVTSITKGMVKAQMNRMSRKAKDKGADNYAPNYFLRCFKSFIQYCIDYHDINMVNPCKGVRTLSLTIKDKYIPSNQEIEIVLEHCNEGQALLVKLAWETGARINELINIDAQKDIDWENNRLTLRTKKSRNQNRSLRKIQIPPCLFKPEILLTEGRLFPQFNTHPKFIEKFLREHGLRKWSWHNLRHKWTVESAQKGVPLLMIMYNLGHSNSATTDRYLKSLSIPTDSWSDDLSDESLYYVEDPSEDPYANSAKSAKSAKSDDF